MLAKKLATKMASIKLYLDTRATRGCAPAPLKILIIHKGASTTCPIGIRINPQFWDRTSGRVLKSPDYQLLNIQISTIFNKWSMALLNIIESGRLREIQSIAELKMMLLFELNPDEFKPRDNFLKVYIAYMENRKAPGTRNVYLQTLRKIREFDKDITSRSFQDIDRKWLMNFENFLSRTNRSANARAIHFRNIRAVFNDAIDDELTTSYPFRKFKIKTERTAKRSLSVQQLRALMDYPCEDYQRKYRDIFVLMVYLCGINAVDLFNARSSAIVDGRLEYRRAKTGKLYSVKIEPVLLYLKSEFHLCISLCTRKPGNITNLK